MTNNTLHRAFFNWKKYATAFSLMFVFAFSAYSQNRQLALIIGIDTYKPSLNEPMAIETKRTWSNLDGCVNDATAIRDLAIAKYAFQTENITTLLNAEASRDRIIKELEKLVATAKKGDVVFIYYAGHGSQVKNSLSAEADKKDETIVPADAWKKGVADIRDKELAKYFNLLLDKGVLLTVIMDSCHSGSGSRGDNFLYDPPKARYIEEANYDAKDATVPQRPEERGALILAAAQDFEYAKEHRDENNVAHGAFTSALLKATQQLNVDATANDLYVSLSAIMKYYGKTQEPSIAGNADRRNGTLLGLQKGSLKNRFMVPTSRLEAKGIEMQGGFAFGIAEGMKLANGKDTLQIIEM
ncbi:MAG: caspase family protein, partial [Sphingobacteriales bacterium]